MAASILGRYRRPQGRRRHLGLASGSRCPWRYRHDMCPLLRKWAELDECLQQVQPRHFLHMARSRNRPGLWPLAACHRKEANIPHQDGLARAIRSRLGTTETIGRVAVTEAGHSCSRLRGIFLGNFFASIERNFLGNFFVTPCKKSYPKKFLSIDASHTTITYTTTLCENA